MFYSVSVLSSKAALGQIWIAGTYTNQKIPKRTIQEINVSAKCKDIINPVVELSLRITSHLMYGVTRVHDAQVQQYANDCNAVLVKVRLAYRPAEQPRTAKAYEVEVQPLLEMPANLEEIILPNIGEELLNMMPAMQDEVILPPMGEELLSHPQPAARIIQPSQLEQLGPFPAPELEVGIAGRPGITAPMLPDDLRLPDFELPLPEPVEAPLIPEQAEAPEIPLPEFGEREELPEEAGRRKRRARAKQPVFDTQTILSSDHIKATLRDASDTMMDRPVKTARVTNVMTSVMHAPALSLPRALRNTWAKLAWLPDRGIAGQFPVQSESLLPDVEQLRAELSASRHEIPIHVPSPLAPIQPPQMSKAPSPIPMMPPLDTLREEYEPLMPEIPEVEQRPSPPPVSARVPVPREPVREQAPEEAERVNKFHQYLYDEHFDSHGAKVRDSVSFFSVTADSSKSIAAKAFYYSLSLNNQGKLKLRQDEPYADITVFDVVEPM